MSRGMIDVLPDEASLAMILTHELAHIVLGHHLNTKLAFNDRMFFPDERTFERMDFARDKSEEEAADKKAIELLNNSPYKDKLEQRRLVPQGGPGPRSGVEEPDPGASGRQPAQRRRHQDVVFDDRLAAIRSRRKRTRSRRFHSVAGSRSTRGPINSN